MYHRFGNFIGEAPESEEEDLQNGDAGPSYVYDEESEAADEVNDQQLMEVDGT